MNSIGGSTPRVFEVSPNQLGSRTRPVLERLDTMNLGERRATSPHYSPVTPNYLPSSPSYDEKNDSRLSGRNWCLTVPNYSLQLYDDICNAIQGDKFRYGIVGKEVGGETGLPHLQMFVVFKNSVRFAAVKKLFPTAHIEKARGTAEQNIEYCSKEFNFVEFGEKPSTGILVPVFSAGFFDYIFPTSKTP